MHRALQAVNDSAANPSMESAPIIGMGAEYPQLLEVTERLNENVAQLHRSVCLFMGQAWTKVQLPCTLTSPILITRCHWSRARGGVMKALLWISRTC